MSIRLIYKGRALHGCQEDAGVLTKSPFHIATFIHGAALCGEILTVLDRQTQRVTYYILSVHIHSLLSQREIAENVLWSNVVDKFAAQRIEINPAEEISLSVYGIAKVDTFCILALNLPEDKEPDAVLEQIFNA